MPGAGSRSTDDFYGTIHGGGSYYDPVTLVRDNEPIQVTDRNYYYTNAITENALRFMDGFHRSSRHYFLYVAYTAPHYPLHALARDLARCRGRYNTGWEATRLARHHRMKQLGIVDSRATLPPREDSLPPWAEQPISWKDAPHKEWQARRMEVYAAMVENMDRNIATLLDSVAPQKKRTSSDCGFASRPSRSPESLSIGLPVLGQPHRWSVRPRAKLG